MNRIVLLYEPSAKHVFSILRLHYDIIAPRAKAIIRHGRTSRSHTT